MGSESINLRAGDSSGRNIHKYGERRDSLNIKHKILNYIGKKGSSGGDDSFNNLISNRKDSITSKPDDRISI